ncbi:hypothetical protein BDFB_014959 [Asbolus verrucosus]|uniref:Uncharacterized protein n=1 Tax=Asbolus verrucosus TaxID=1661398 RepID=A0A482W0Z3_ASBVE|nr:hypothetical protein BDFB_014959 [Asbolus verrucosus]
MNSSIQSLYKRRYPELGDIKEDFEVIEQSFKFRSKKQNEETRKKMVKIVFTGEEDLWKKLKQLKEEVENDKWVSIHHLNFMSNGKLKKMTESIFHRTDTKVITPGCTVGELHHY